MSDVCVDGTFAESRPVADAAEGPLAVGLDPRQDATVDGDAVNAERVSNFVD
jgi:hypothetical protein